MRKSILLFFLFVSLSCVENTAPTSISLIAEEYINSVLDIMQNNSINKYKIEWTSFRENTFNYAGHPQTTSETYPAIKFAIKNLGDNHSLFLEPMLSKESFREINLTISNQLNLAKSNTDPIGIKLTENIGFIRIPAFVGIGEVETNFANDIQNLIKEVDSPNIKGWVVDLRHNTGGNMWPMLTGIGPILGNGLAGKFVDADSNVSNWYYENGKSIANNSIVVEVKNPYTLFNQNPYAAILIDNFTASSGEAIVIAFLKRKDTRSFGIPTLGVSTANRGYKLSDGASLHLTVATMADRDGNLYGSKIVPDQIVNGEIGTDPKTNDDVVSAAVSWLESKI